MSVSSPRWTWGQTFFAIGLARLKIVLLRGKIFHDKAYSTTGYSLYNVVEGLAESQVWVRKLRTIMGDWNTAFAVVMKMDGAERPMDRQNESLIRMENTRHLYCVAPYIAAIRGCGGCGFLKFVWMVA